MYGICNGIVTPPSKNKITHFFYIFLWFYFFFFSFVDSNMSAISRDAEGSYLFPGQIPALMRQPCIPHQFTSILIHSWVAEPSILRRMWTKIMKKQLWIIYSALWPGNMNFPQCSNEKINELGWHEIVLLNKIMNYGNLINIMRYVFFIFNNNDKCGSWCSDVTFSNCVWLRHFPLFSEIKKYASNILHWIFIFQNEKCHVP